MSITPIDIIGAMKHMGWSVAPDLMDRWVKAPAWTMDSDTKIGITPAKTLPASRVDTSRVTMKWLLGYKVPKSAFDELAANALDAYALNQLRSRLREAGWITGAFKHRPSTLSAVELDSGYDVNYRTFGSSTDTINDLYGAIGNGMFKVAVVGRVEPRGKAHVFMVEKLGIYFRDAYDFNDSGLLSQPLGVWNKHRVLGKAETALFFGPAISAYRKNGFTYVNNATFRDWRDLNGLGGDFLIYSDVEWISPPMNAIVL